jgi:hypothetical protein
MAEINIRINQGFKLDMSYTADLPTLAKEYVDKFAKAENVTVNISEEVVIRHNPKPYDSIQVSDDGKTITIDFQMRRYMDNKGKLTAHDSPTEFYKRLSFVLDRAIRIDKGEEVQ